jgi:hypothetical protein
MKKTFSIFCGILIFTIANGQDKKFYAGGSVYRHNAITLMTGDTYDGGPYNVTTPVFGFGGCLGYQFHSKVSAELQFHKTELVNFYSIFANNVNTLLPEEGRFAEVRWNATEFGVLLKYNLVTFEGLNVWVSAGLQYISRGSLKSDSLFKARDQEIPSTGETLTYIIQGPFIDEFDGFTYNSGFSADYDLGKHLNVSTSLTWVAGVKPILSTKMTATRSSDPSDPKAVWLQHSATSTNSGLRFGLTVTAFFNTSAPQ